MDSQNEYELAREARIAENKARLTLSGVPATLKEIADSHRSAKPKPKPKVEEEAGPQQERRRSPRLADAVAPSQPAEMEEVGKEENGREMREKRFLIALKGPPFMGLLLKEDEVGISLFKRLDARTRASLCAAPVRRPCAPPSSCSRPRGLICPICPRHAFTTH
jgi:hypothetical protein